MVELLGWGVLTLAAVLVAGFVWCAIEAWWQERRHERQAKRRTERDLHEHGAGCPCERCQECADRDEYRRQAYEERARYGLARRRD